jgi:hypothetical protein
MCCFCISRTAWFTSDWLSDSFLDTAKQKWLSLSCSPRQTLSLPVEGLVCRTGTALKKFSFMMLFVTIFYEKTHAKKVLPSTVYCLGLKPKAIKPVAKV